MYESRDMATVSWEYDRGNGYQGTELYVVWKDKTGKFNHIKLEDYTKDKRTSTIKEKGEIIEVQVFDSGRYNPDKNYYRFRKKDLLEGKGAEISGI